jgi:hypothetical protein
LGAFENKNLLREEYVKPIREELWRNWGISKKVKEHLEI